MNVFSHPFFWISGSLTLLGLCLAGLMLAGVIVSEPPEYHRTRFLSFPLPEGWRCNREGQETVCTPGGLPPYEAIIIFAAKLRGDSDTLAAYQEHLEKPRVLSADDGSSLQSTIQYLREVELGGRKWIDGLHLDSEILGYNTRYLGTVTSHLGVLLTFSAHADHFEKYNDVFERCVADLTTQQTASPFD